MIFKTILYSVLSASTLAAIIAKIQTIINPPHTHFGPGFVIVMLVGIATTTAFVCSVVAAFIWRSSLKTNWLKIVIGITIIAQIVILGFIFT